MPVKGAAFKDAPGKVQGEVSKTTLTTETYWSMGPSLDKH